jgi:hypothetical protein
MTRRRRDDAAFSRFALVFAAEHIAPQELLSIVESGLTTGHTSS